MKALIVAIAVVLTVLFYGWVIAKMWRCSK